MSKSVGSHAPCHRQTRCKVEGNKKALPILLWQRIIKMHFMDRYRGNKSTDYLAYRGAAAGTWHWIYSRSACAQCRPCGSLQKRNLPRNRWWHPFRKNRLHRRQCNAATEFLILPSNRRTFCQYYRIHSAPRWSIWQIFIEWHPQSYAQLMINVFVLAPITRRVWLPSE